VREVLLPLAHALVGRKDLPIPAWLFAWGASLVLIVSFVALSYGWREPRLEGDSWRAVSERWSRILTGTAAQALAAVVGVLLFLLVIWSGLHGTDAPDRNFALTFVFVSFWLGMVLLSVLFGNVFRAFNPWRTIGRTVSAGFKAIAGQSAPAPLKYPDWLGRWPAALGILAFVWLELIYGAGGLTVGLNPHVTAISVIVYSGITFIAMGLFGVEEWIERGETFSVYMAMFARLAPLEVRDGKLGARRPLSGAVGWTEEAPGSVALVVATIGATSFDGGQEGVFASGITSLFDKLRDAGISALTAFRLTDTIFLIAVVLGVGAVFALGIAGMRTIDRDRTAAELRRIFGHTLIPIALAYLVAHYFSLFVFQEQAQFTFLLSDPLGTGHDYFGTAGYGINYAAIGATAVWYVQVAALVIGHVAALTLAHDKAIAIYGEPEKATRSQYWMLSVMVAFTCFGLFLLSQANG
jgi:hypothetical protein